MGRRQSVSRQIKRGSYCEALQCNMPKRAFNNRKRTSGRAIQVIQQKAHGRIKGELQYGESSVL